MKKAFYSLCMALICFSCGNPAHAEGKTKTVCQDVKRKDGQVMRDKAGKPVQECKKIKVHKKFEGTEVPTKK
jgi:hypothetical protein